MPEDLRELLRKVPLFTDLSDHHIEAVLDIAKEVSHEPGKAVVEQASEGVGFHLILSGEAEIQLSGRTVGKMGPGGYFGEISIIDGKPRTASIVATTPMRTLVIPGWDFQMLMDTNPAVMKAALLLVCDRLRSTQALLS